MAAGLKCPVCGKPLTRKEFDKALGLWEEKQQHRLHYKVPFVWSVTLPDFIRQRMTQPE